MSDPLGSWTVVVVRSFVDMRSSASNAISFGFTNVQNGRVKVSKIVECVDDMEGSGRVWCVSNVVRCLVFVMKRTGLDGVELLRIMRCSIGDSLVQDDAEFWDCHFICC
jgi:hypothetical protein